MVKGRHKSLGIVLTGGGARSAYPLGVLKFIFHDLNVNPQDVVLVGSSAGAINAHYLAQNAHRGFGVIINELCGVWEGLHVESIYKTNISSISKLVGRWLYNSTIGKLSHKQKIESFLDSTPLYELLKSLSDTRQLHKNIEEGVISGLGITATQYGTGRAITFYHASPTNPVKKWWYPKREGVPTKIGLKHVLASAAIPVLFPSVRVGKYFYGDGSVRFTAPLSPAIHMGANKILAIGLRKIETSELVPAQEYPSIAQIGGTLLNAIFHDSLDYDVHTLRKINKLVQISRESLEDYVFINTILVQPSRDLGILALAYEQSMPQKLKFLLKSLGSQGRGSADLLSYLLFEGIYIKKLIQLGYEDAKARKIEIETFFSDHK
ncbi:MAG: patatin-like phospholipase family protein [Deltaproteobacteria bacterium]|nr:patatin-like phospholipase family protein [Deltaproteobacteria bacterium]